MPPALTREGPLPFAGSQIETSRSGLAYGKDFVTQPAPQAGQCVRHVVQEPRTP
jgi:hypothetical protein